MAGRKSNKKKENANVSTKNVFTEEQRQFMLKSRKLAQEKLKLKLKQQKQKQEIEAKNKMKNNWHDEAEDDEIIIIDDDDDFYPPPPLNLTNKENNDNKNNDKNNTTTIKNNDSTSTKTNTNDNNNTVNKPDGEPNLIKDIVNSAIIDNGYALPDSENTSNKNKNSRKRKIVYCDYNLSEIVDTKGGFLIEKTEGDDQPPEPEKKVKHLQPINLELDKNPKCQECESLDIDFNYLDNFNVLVCRSCRTKMPEKYSLLTKTECKEDYLLTDSELRDRELLPCWERPNPHKSTWNNMMLFVRYQVEEYAFKKWGSEQGLDDEFDRRETEKRQRKEKKFNAKLKELRRNTRTSIWLKEKKKAHVHEFGETSINEETGESFRRCKTCGFLEEFEEF